MKIFSLEYAWYEESQHYIFIGPEECSQEQFQEICNDIVPLAGLQTLANANNDPYVNKGYIGWMELTEAMIPFLEEKGFKHVIPIQANFRGSGGIISTHDSKPLKNVASNVIHHNNLVEHNMHAEYENETFVEEYLASLM